MNEHAGERNALLHAAREAADQVVAPPGHVGERERVADDFVPLRLAEPVGRAEEVEILKDAHLPVHREVIRHEAHAAADLVALGDDVMAEDLHAGAARVAWLRERGTLRLEQRGEDFQRGGFARAVRADEPVDGLPLHGEAHAAQRLVRLVAVREVGDVDDVFGVHVGGWRVRRGGWKKALSS